LVAGLGGRGREVVGRRAGGRRRGAGRRCGGVGVAARRRGRVLRVVVLLLTVRAGAVPVPTVRAVPVAGALAAPAAGPLPGVLVSSAAVGDARVLAIAVLVLAAVYVVEDGAVLVYAVGADLYGRVVVRVRVDRLIRVSRR